MRFYLSSILVAALTFVVSATVTAIEIPDGTKFRPSDVWLEICSEAPGELAEKCRPHESVWRDGQLISVQLGESRQLFSRVQGDTIYGIVNGQEVPLLLIRVDDGFVHLFPIVITTVERTAQGLEHHREVFDDEGPIYVSLNRVESERNHR